jgi:capsular polysaccharide biosynthesis protein
MRELLGTKMFLTGVIARVDGTTEISGRRYDEIARKIYIWPYGTHIVYVQASSDDPDEASKIAQAVIDEFGAVFARQIKDTAVRQADFYKEQAALAKVDFDRATTELQTLLRLRPSVANTNPNAPRPASATVTDPEYSRLLIAYETAQGQYDRMAARYADSQINATSANAVTAYYLIVDRPEVPNAPILPSKKALLAKPVTGVVFGAFLAAGLVLMAWRLDRKVRYASDLAFAGEDVVVLTLPSLRARRRRWPADFVRLGMAIQGGIRNLSMKPQADLSDGGS